MMLYDGAAQFLMFRRNSGRSRMSAGRRNASTENASRGAPVGAGGGMAVVEGVDHMLRAGEGVGVAPGCEIGVREVVLVKSGLK